MVGGLSASGEDWPMPAATPRQGRKRHGGPASPQMARRGLWSKHRSGRSEEREMMRKTMLAAAALLLAAVGPACGEGHGVSLPPPALDAPKQAGREVAVLAGG